MGNRVKLPGASKTDPNVYQFGEATYESIYKDLAAKDEALYTRTGLLSMLQRNMAIKPAPQRWQDHRSAAQLLVHLNACLLPPGNQLDRKAPGTHAARRSMKKQASSGLVTAPVLLPLMQ